MIILICNQDTGEQIADVPNREALAQWFAASDEWQQSGDLCANHSTGILYALAIPKP